MNPQNPLPTTTDGAPPMPVPSPSPIPTTPPKKGISGKLIAAILGVFVLVAAIGAGVILVQQQQDIREKAAGTGDTTGCIQYWIYKCPGATDPSVGCQQGGVQSNTLPSFESPYCGIQQIDCLVETVPGACFLGVNGTTCYSRFISSDVSQASCGGTTPSTPPAGGGCGTPCTDVSQCNIPGAVNPACSNGVCWDAAMCGTTASTPPTGTGGPCGSSCSSTDQCTDGSICFQSKCINPECKRNPGACDTTGCKAVVACESTDCRIGGSICTSEGTCNQTTGVCQCGETPTAQCMEIKAYDTSWTLLTAQDLTLLQPGDIVRFTVAGSATSGAFDQARFTVNGTQRSPVTTKKPNSTTEFYDEYTVLAGDTGLTVSAQVHHTGLNQWY